MTIKAKFVHTNLIARDWKRLAQFYEQVFGCKRVPPERMLSGSVVEDLTGISDAEILGAHLRLPGYEDLGPTLEIFQYNRVEKQARKAVNRQGFAHIAFSVEDVDAAKDAVIEAGGRTLGKVVSLEIPGAGRVKLVYIRDPEGNLVELQHWK